MAKLTPEQIAAVEAKIVFCQKIMYDRSKGFCGEFYVGKKPVQRSVMVIKCDQASSIMVERGMPYKVFMLGEMFQCDTAPYPHFFSTPEAAIEFAKAELKHHKLVGVPSGTHA